MKNNFKNLDFRIFHVFVQNFIQRYDQTRLNMKKTGMKKLE